MGWDKRKNNVELKKKKKEQKKEPRNNGKKKGEGRWRRGVRIKLKMLKMKNDDVRGWRCQERKHIF